MSVYVINWNDFATDYLPPDKREPITKAFLGANLEPLNTLHVDTFDVFKPDIIDRTKHNGQRILMESVLNAAFSVISAPFIYIDNSGDNVTPNIFFNESEALPPFTLYNASEGQTPAYFYNQAEVTNNRNFVVYVPTAVYAAVGEAAIKQQVDRLRPYSTFYTIVQY
jgi:hypothetical protein